MDLVIAASTLVVPVRLEPMLPRSTTSSCRWG
jgi:hypothetical protein